MWYPHHVSGGDTHIEKKGDYIKMIKIKRFMLVLFLAAIFMIIVIAAEINSIVKTGFMDLFMESVLSIQFSFLLVIAFIELTCAVIMMIGELKSISKLY